MTHGVIIQDQATGVIAITTPETSVIGLVGIAPSGPINTLTMVTSATEASVFGPSVEGFSIPQAISAIFDQGGAKILVVNVFNPATMYTAVADEAQVVKGRKLQLDFVHVGTGGQLVVRTAASGGGTLLVQGTDYTYDAYGILTIKKTNVADGTTLYTSYRKLDEAAITESVINGTVSGDTRTGMEMFDLAASMYNTLPKILIAPYYSQLGAVGAKIATKAALYGAKGAIDITDGLTVAGAIETRGPGEDFSYSDKNLVLLYPWFSYLNPQYQNGLWSHSKNLPLPYSALWAGIVAKTDRTLGFHESPSNIVINNPGTPATVLAGIPGDNENTQWNLLNAAGIVTYFAGFGTGTRTWGNKTTAYPVSGVVEDVFISVGRVKNIIHAALQPAMLPFVDRGISQPLIDAIRESVNAYFRVLKTNGNVIDGFAEYLDEDNPPIDLQAGIVKFRITFMSATPAETIIFKSFIDPTLLNFS